MRVLLATCVWLLCIDATAQSFNNKKVIVSDSMEYSTVFINGWSTYHYMNEVVEFREGYLLIAHHDTIPLPDQITKGKRYAYVGSNGDSMCLLTITRKNSSTLFYKLTISSPSTPYIDSGEVHLDPVHLVTAMDGNCVYYYHRLDENMRTQCNLQICIDGMFNEGYASFHYINCNTEERKLRFDLKSVEDLP